MPDDEAAKENVAPSGSANYPDIRRDPNVSPPPSLVHHFNEAGMHTPEPDDMSEYNSPHQVSPSTGQQILPTTPPESCLNRLSSDRPLDADPATFTIFEDAQSPTPQADARASRTGGAPGALAGFDAASARILREIGPGSSRDGPRGSEGSEESAHSHSSIGVRSETQSSRDIDSAINDEWNELIARREHPRFAAQEIGGSQPIVREQLDPVAATVGGISGRKRQADVQETSTSKRPKTWQDDVDVSAFGPEGSPVRTAAENVIARSRDREPVITAAEAHDVKYSIGHGLPTLKVDGAGHAFVDVPTPSAQSTGRLPSERSANSVTPELARVPGVPEDDADWLTHKIREDQLAERQDRCVEERGCDRSPDRNRLARRGG